MRELSLFTGAGGGLLASRLLGWQTVCAVEIEPYCREVLLRRQRDGLLPVFPIWDDIKTFDGKEWRGRVGVVSGGFPCQPFSVAGQRKADFDERNLWPDTARIIGNIRPRFAFLENVPGLLSSGYFDTVLGDLAAMGYDAEWCVLGAGELGLGHQRKRLWILAYPYEEGLSQRESAALGQAPGDTKLERLGSLPAESFDPARAVVVRGVHEVAGRVDRIKALGNGQVPCVAAAAWRYLTGVVR